MTDKAFVDYFINRVIEILGKSNKCPECKESVEKYKCGVCGKPNVCGKCVEWNGQYGWLCKSCYIEFHRH